MEIKAYAKINLCIDVLGKRPDGYHEVCMVMQQIDLWDRVTVNISRETLSGTGREQSEKGRIVLGCSRTDLPADESNLAWRAAAALLAEYPLNDRIPGVDIYIEKNIPLAAGLGGGSADAAAVLHGLNQLGQLRLSIKELMSLGAKLGADVPFCLMGQAALHPEWGFPQEQASVCALATGVGEKLLPLPSVQPVAPWVLLSKPSVNVSTAAVYQGLCLGDIADRPDVGELVEGIKTKKINKITKNMKNVLETVSLKEYSEIVYTKDKMNSLGSFLDGALSEALMSGSGPTVYRIYADEKKAKNGVSEIKRFNEESFAVKVL